ncbi:conjugal transfer protein [Mycobacterium sp.]|uniref:conjugal transfer protein n=1 Tax=Mycobacterium sp. TaxID=1785 RepID=UPI002C7A0062|nr:conjugal transfer protein [Mycobacterium sp.]HME48092.1 conjugal transfer protein [Mycobacterium sp.]
MPALSNTWKRRLAAGAHGGGRIVVIILVASAALNGLALIWHAVFPQAPPPIAGTARTVVNQSDLVKAFAVDCVSSWLTAATTEQPDLGRCYPGTDKITLPTTPALIVTAPLAQATAQGPSHNDISTYGVIVGVTERPYPTAPPTRAYYQLSVSVYDGAGPRALTTPARIDPPPPGADVDLGYPHTVTTNSPLAGMLGGFITCYLTGAPGLERFITPDSGLTALHAYAAAAVRAIQAAANPPDNPADHTEIHVLLTVSARSAGYTPYDLTYPLTVRADAGSWSVAAIDPVPQLADATAGPDKEK